MTAEIEPSSGGPAAYVERKKIDPESLRAVSILLQSQNSSGELAIKKIGLSFKSLSVTAPGELTTTVKTLPRAILNTFGPDQYKFLKSNIFREFRKGTSRNGGCKLLADFTGLVKPGEMLLVLGRPGSGCSTFLRTVANRSTLDIRGDLIYESTPAPQFKRHHQRETIYLPEEDRHIASLSVRQTIRFALRMSMPTQVRTKQVVEELTEVIAKLFGLGHALETPVGSAFSPGVSGGERKRRVSIAEVLAAGSSIQCFDNSTRGLDSSTALDFVKSLRVLTDVGQKTTLATLYQAGEELYNHFDKVLLIDEGREVFFGSTSEARAYFEDLGYIPVPGQTTAEFLVSITDPTQRRSKPKSHAHNIRSPDDLAAAFRGSGKFMNLDHEIQRYQQFAAAEEKLLPGTAFNLTFPKQIWECLVREYQLVTAQRRVYYVKWITTIILCLSCGSVYWDITNTGQGAFTRGGILFFALIINGWLQFPELFDAHTNRSVLERQGHLHLYRPSAVAVARFLIDLPLIAFQHVIFMLAFYFLTRLQLDPGKFFIFFLTLFISTVNFSNLLRMFAYYVGTLDDCFRYGGFSCTVLLLFAGFLIPAKDMRLYFGWLHWINPMYYAFENLFANEFTNLTLDCSDGNLIPGTGNSISLANQACTIPGAVPGSANVAGADYVSAYGFSKSHIWRNISIMIGIALTYLFVGAVSSEIMNFAPQGGSPLVFVNSSECHKGKTGTALDVEKMVPITSSSDISLRSEKFLVTGHAALTWKNLTLDIGDKQILKGITGYVKRGQLTALCGASGAGKTTLLSALSQTNFAGKMGGEVLFHNKPPGAEFKKVTGFAQQMDLHDGTATVREALEFSALLRQPKHFSKREKLAHVDTVLELLDLNKVADALIGDVDGGLGVEQMKRVTIGVELAARPHILFADEPTSGLDSQGAAHIIQYLRKLAHQGQAIIVTVHQPSALLFSQFDNLLALSSEGEQLYFGRVDAALTYFERNGAPCPPGANPAEFILETVGAGISARTSDKGSDWSAKWKASIESRSLTDEIESKKTTVSPSLDEIDLSEYNASTLLQTRLLTIRIMKNQWRNTPYVYSKIWVHVISAIFVGFTFFKAGTSPQDLQNRSFSVYFILFLCNAIVNVILARYFFASLYWQFREGPSRTYGWVAFVSANIIAEFPAAILVTVIYFLLWYFPSGLPHSQAGYIFLFLLTYEIFQVLLGLFMMALSPDLGFAGNVLVFIVCTCNWFNGIIVPYNQIQVFWRYWLYYLNPFTYPVGSMVKAVISDVVVTCSTSDLTHFSPPGGQTCGEYAGPWAASAFAQLLNPNATDECSVCKWTSGDQYLDGFNLGDGGLLASKWSYWGIFLVFTFTNLGLVYFFTWATKVKRWKLFYFF
ncbi:uncharacterized protein K441DRAFT_606404 [Cenococcum geophilum 1.58]|uniref:uncharacterized protein n=1 Tax=Cenococcum geophilum 1.58 TaxID=794803 RepID=UPI00358F227A|nr:hypothetical protein K441DRAFT_606404 [Cenococcum geophilum 1.58]